jgi:hypothetical protein
LPSLEELLGQNAWHAASRGAPAANLHLNPQNGVKKIIIGLN